MDKVGHYTRVPVDVILGNKFLQSHEDQDKIACQCYVYNGTLEEFQRLLALPHREIYESNGPHGLVYKVCIKINIIFKKKKLNFLTIYKWQYTIIFLTFSKSGMNRR